MANSCITYYHMTCKNRKMLEEIHEKIQAQLKTPSTDKMTDPEWTGHLLPIFGIEDEPGRDWLMSSELTDEGLDIVEEGAWRMQGTMQALIHGLNKRLGEDEQIDVLYSSEEPGCEWFATNDKDGIWFEPYIAYFPDEEDYYRTLEGLQDAIEGETKEDGLDTLEKIQAACERYEAAHPDDRMKVYDFGYIPF